MKDLSKLDSTVLELEVQANELKKHNGLLEKVTLLTNNIEQGLGELVSGNKNFDSLKSDLQSKLKSLNEQISQLDKTNAGYLEKLVQVNKDFSRDLESTVAEKLNSIKDQVTKLDQTTAASFEKLIVANKDFLRELESGVTSKLERFSSDISVTVRQERTQLQEALLNTLATKFSDQNTLFEKQSKSITQIRQILYFIAAVCCGIAIGLWFK